jgi:tetratricopeptide (TPR) repeat protein
MQAVPRQESAALACPSDNQLLELIQHRLSSADGQEVNRHVDRCSDCRAVLAELVRGQAPKADGAPAETGPSTSDREPVLLESGDKIGRYEILGLVGAGGMGVVYAAFDPTLDRKVALKLLRGDPADAGGESPARLIREAQAMARLSHPNVVAVHAVDAIDGRVFLTMEFVEGMTLGDWLRREHRPWREVLDRFLEAGRGLAAAHAAGLVHRDFKPDNVLVGTDGRVRVTDFGLARRQPEAARARTAASQPPASTSLSETGALAGTPVYMAPEQIRGGAATPLSDQYSFCIALHEGLYGRRPTSGHPAASDGAQGPTGAARDASVPRWVKRAVESGLAVDPAARHPSMVSLLGVLSAGRRRAQRRRAIAATLGIVALGTSLGGYLVAHRLARAACQGASDKLIDVWDPARRGEVHHAFDNTHAPFASDAWRGVSERLDRYTAAWVAARTQACEATRVRGEQSGELLDLRMQCLDEKLQGVQALTTELARADEQTVEKAIAAADALPSLEPCANAKALRSRVKPPKDPVLVPTVARLRKELELAKTLDRTGKYARAQEAAEAVLSAARSLRYPPLEAEALHRVGTEHARLGELERAADAYRDAIAAAQASGHEEIAASAWSELISVLAELHRFDESARASDYAAATIERLGDRELEVDRLLNVSAAMREQGRFDEGVVSAKRALTILEHSTGATGRGVEDAYEAMAITLAGLDQAADALEYSRRVVTVRREKLGGEHPSVALALNNLGNGLLLLGRWQEALDTLQEAAAICARSLPATHSTCGLVDVNLGEALVRLERYEEARPHLESAQKSVDHLAAQGALGLLAELATHEKRYDQAEAYARKMLDLVSADSADAESGDALAALAQVLILRGRPRAALPYAKRALASYQSVGPDAPPALEQEFQVAEAELGAGSSQPSLPPLERALKRLESKEVTPAELAAARFVLASVLWNAGADRPRALALAESARETYRKDGHQRDALERLERWWRSHVRSR